MNLWKYAAAEIIPKTSIWIILIAFILTLYHFARDIKSFNMRSGPEATCFYRIFCLLLRYCSLPDISADGIGGSSLVFNIYIYIW